jgi:NodT family efflux transporter outer membrane factor (OMF) lipoprotein
MASRHPLRPRRSCRHLSAATFAALLTGCAAGPDYVRPPIDVPAAFKESGPWKSAEPGVVDARHPWWQLYADPALDRLIEQAGIANQNIRQAEAQYRQARAIVAEAQASFWPDIGASLGVGRARSNSVTGVHTGNQASVGLNASWEPDLWGAVRRAVESGEAGARASADDLAAARLSIQSALAQDYLQLRVTDLLLDQYAATTAAYAKALALTQSQYRAGVALRSDVALAESQLETAQAAAADLEASRAQLEHAIAILTGQAPAAFDLPRLPLGVDDLKGRLPVTPPGLPSALLERRPDIAAAERRVALANANIGVAQAAYFPSLLLSASGGSASGSLAPLFAAPTNVWSLGATLAQTLFDGGLRRARTAQSTAAYDVSVAQYKETVLASFQQVEDDLATLRVLERESALLTASVAASQLAERSVLAQYRAGTTNYLSVVTAQTLSLANQRSATQVLGRQLAASVALIAAIGGGWSVDDPIAGAPASSALPATATSPSGERSLRPVASTRPESGVQP